MDYKITTIMSLLIELEDKLCSKVFYKDFMIENNPSSINWDGEEFSISILDTLDFDVSFKKYDSDTIICLYTEGGFELLSFKGTLKEEYENILGYDDTQIILEHGRKMKMLIHLYDDGFIDCYDYIKKELMDV